MSIPGWLHVLGWLSVVAAVVCCAWIAIDVAFRRRQHVWIMNLVWPLTALYAGPFALWAYRRVGVGMTHEATRVDRKEGKASPGSRRSTIAAAALGATHCGSGCTLGDLVAEWFVVFVPITLFGRAIFGTWTLDFVLAFLFGIAFQYFTIKPMRNLSVVEGLAAALKADTASLVAWQVGMYGWMVIVTFVVFQREIPKTDPVFWFMMQIAMIVGFLVAWPVNVWLIDRGLKEKM